LDFLVVMADSLVALKMGGGSHLTAKRTARGAERGALPQRGREATRIMAIMPTQIVILRVLTPNHRNC